MPYLVFALFRVPLPLTGAEPPHPEVMKRPPRPRSAQAWLALLPLALAMAALEEGRKAWARRRADHHQWESRQLR